MIGYTKLGAHFVRGSDQMRMHSTVIEIMDDGDD